MRNVHGNHTTTYNHLNVSFGYAYDAGALVPDGTSAPPSSDPVQIYQPSTRPGCSVPNATFDDLHRRVPLSDLLGRNRFVLLTGEDGEVWRAPANRAAGEYGIALDVAVIGPDDGDWLDMRRQWERAREIGPSGAVLVRPDRFVAWRTMQAPPSPDLALHEALSRVLGKSAQAPGSRVKTSAGELWRERIGLARDTSRHPALSRV